MVTLDEIRSKAELLYPRAIRAWLDGNSEFFPARLKVSTARDADINIARQAQHTLIEHSNASGKPSYSLRFRKLKSRLHFEQNFISGIYFDTMSDLVSFLGKQSEFDELVQCVSQLDDALPELKGWRSPNWRMLLRHARELTELIAFAQYVRAHPMPGCHVRELPIAISTKTIDRCEAIMAQWLEILLPPIAKSKTATSFAERFGFEESKDHFRLKILDNELLPQLGLPCDELSLPVTALASLPVHDCQVIMVENKINLIKLPSMPRTLALGGLGYGIVRLFDLPWISANPLSYWGDIDVDGFEILARVRQRFPQVRSVLMDSRTLAHCKPLIVRGNAYPSTRSFPQQLIDDELVAYHLCRAESLRLEQERVPREFVADYLKSQCT